MAKKEYISNGWTDRLYYVSRCSTVVMFVLLLFSDLNPARIYNGMNRNISLLTAATSYNRLAKNYAYALKNNILLKSDFYYLMAAAALLAGGIIIFCLAQCASLGNLKFKRLANYVSLGSVQVLTTVPNFISWVLVYAIAFAIFSTDGFINTLMNNISGTNLYHTDFLSDDSFLYLKMLAWGMWKGVGWSAIYAQSDNEYNYLVNEMITKANAYGYGDCLEYSRSEAEKRHVLELEVTNR